MFGRQDDEDDTNQQLDDNHAAYVTDLTAPDTTNVASSGITPLPLPDLQTTSPSLTSAPALVQDTPIVAESTSTDTSHDELLDIKHLALNQLSPLVDHLEQSPEEKFKTTMMLIQASDNPLLIKQAYTSAQNIQDDAVRAQALLDVVNEINYFTQQAK